MSNQNENTDNKQGEKMKKTIMDAKKEIDELAQEQHARDYLDVDNFDIQINSKCDGLNFLLHTKRSEGLAALKAANKTATGKFVVKALLQEQTIDIKELEAASDIVTADAEEVVNALISSYFRAILRIPTDEGFNVIDPEAFSDGLMHLVRFVLNKDSDTLLIFNTRLGMFERAEKKLHSLINALCRIIAIPWTQKLSSAIQVRIKFSATAIPLGEFNKRVVNFGDGRTWDLQKHTIEVAKPEDLSVSALGVIPNEGSTDEWEQALLRVFENDAKTAHLFELALAASLDHESRKANQMYWLYGEQNNGKSSLLRVIIRILGFDDLTPMNIAELNKDFELANVVSNSGVIVRAIIGEENESTLTNRDITNIKRLSEGSPVTIRRKNLPALQVQRLSAAMYQSFNKLPMLRDEPAVVRRLVLFPFLVDMSESGQLDPHINEKLAAEAPAIALRLLRLLPELQENKYKIGDSNKMTVFKEEWLSKSGVINPVDRFVEKNIVINSQSHVSRKKLFEVYQTRMLDSTQYATSRSFYTKFEEAMSSIYGASLEPSKTNGKSVYRGIEIKSK